MSMRSIRTLADNIRALRGDDEGQGREYVPDLEAEARTQEQIEAENAAWYAALKGNPEASR